MAKKTSAPQASSAMGMMCHGTRDGPESKAFASSGAHHSGDSHGTSQAIALLLLGRFKPLSLLGERTD